MHAPKLGRGRAALGAALLVSITVAALARAAADEPQIGAPAPPFTAVDSQGQVRHLGEFRGKTVVLEWTNAECPFTRKHYTSGNMQSVQAAAQEHGVVWLSVVSSAPGKQGYVDAAGAEQLTRSRKAQPTAVLLDPSGTMGRLYHARPRRTCSSSTRTAFCRYMGGIDSIATADVDGHFQSGALSERGDAGGGR